MISLNATGIARDITADLIARVSLIPVPEPERATTVHVTPSPSTGESLDGYAAIVTSTGLITDTRNVPAVFGCPIDHLEQGDVVAISPRGHVRTLYRRRSRSNTLFTTDRCNSLCLMCSQPPKTVDDGWRVAELLQLIKLIDPSTEELGITGGEPTLLGQGLLDVIAACDDRLPKTALHVLSNGRRFAYSSYARALGDLAHHDLMVGIPVYSDIGTQHDYVVQARGAFDETIIGLHNLAQASVPVEIRVVVHRHTFARLPQLAEYIYRNLTFAAHVTFMGLEVIGFGKANIASLWIDPIDYADELEAAVLMLSTAGVNVSVYNHQLCTLPVSLWPFSRRSISDWKNDFAEECTACREQTRCGGFFSWNLGAYRSRGIRAVAQ